jgi:hypothetical protein
VQADGGYNGKTAASAAILGQRAWPASIALACEVSNGQRSGPKAGGSSAPIRGWAPRAPTAFGGDDDP